MSAPTAADADILTVDTHAGGHVSRWRNLIIEYAADSSFESLRALRRVVDPWFRDAPAPLGVIVIVTPSAGGPPPGFREELNALWKRWESGIALNAIVIDGEGFRLAALRALATGMSLLARWTFPVKVFATPAEAADWTSELLARRGTPCGPASELLAVLESLADRRPSAR